MRLIFLLVILFILIANICAIVNHSEQLTPLELNTIAVFDTTTYSDSTVTLQVDVENYEEFVAFQVDLILPYGLDYIENTAQLTDRSQDHILQVNYIGQDTLRIISFSMNMLPFLGTSGPVAELEFEVNLEVGFYSIILTNGLLANVNSENILDEMINGQLTVLPLVSVDSNNFHASDISFTGNYPNPFNQNTIIKFNVNQKTKVEISVYNIKGQKVKTLCNELLEANNYELMWHGKNSSGLPVAKGVYFFQLKADPQAGGCQKITRKILLTR